MEMTSEQRSALINATETLRHVIKDNVLRERIGQHLDLNDEALLADYRTLCRMIGDTYKGGT